VVVSTGETLCEPEVPLGVKPTPMHDVALVELQVRVLLPPSVIVLGLAESVAVGVGGGTELTVTVALFETEPPIPVQVIEYVVVCDGVTLCEPEVPVVVNPLPVQAVAPVEVQVRVDDCPAVIDAGFAVKVAVGAGCT